MRYFILACLHILLIGCSGSSSDSPGSTPDTTEPLTTEPNNLHELVGNWLSTCHVTSGSFNSIYALIELEFTDDGAYYSDTTIYTDDNCTMPMDPNPTIQGSSTYTLGDSMISSDGNPVTLISFTSTIEESGTFIYERSYRINGDELNLSDVPFGSITEINYNITYIKQKT